MKTHLKSILLILITITLLTSIVSSVSAKKVSATNTSGSISGYKFNDINGNGSWDNGEPVLPNWTIKLTMSNGSNITNTTNANGLFMFSNLSAGNYTLKEVQQTGWVQTFPIKIYGKTYYNITLSEGENWNVSGFGNMRIPRSTFNISGFKLNGDTGKGIQGWNITLSNGTMQKSIQTGADGSYKFTGLVNSTYNVSEEMRQGFTPVGATFRKITIENMDVMNVNFTNKPVVSTVPTFNISGFKINGTDNNGMGIPNWNIMLLNTKTGAEITNATTNGKGFYKFSNLSNGTYNVTEKMRTGWTNVSPMSQIVTINGADKTNVNFTNQVIVTPTQTATPTPAPSHSSSGSSGSSGGSSGGGGVISTEPFNNIAKAESHEKDLLANKSVTYSFNPDEYGVYEVLVVGKQNEADVSVRIELLKNLSANVNASVSDSTNVYKYINIKIRSERISEAVLRFKVEAKWLSDNNLVGASMYRWMDGKWQVLDTTETSKDDNYVYYEAHSGGFSSFAIVGNKPISGISVVSPTPTVSLIASPEPAKATSGFDVLFAVVALSVLYMVKRR